MENYDLLSLFKYTPKATGYPDCDEVTDENNPVQNQDPDYVGDIISGNDEDTVTIGDQDVNGFGKELTDEDIEEGLRAQDEGTKISDVGIYKTIGESLLDKLKKLIWWFMHPGEKPDFTEPDPETPVTPDIPENPEIGEDGTDGTGPSTEEQKPIDEDLKLSRGDAQKTVTLTSQEKVLTLVNPFGGANYQYTLTSVTGSSVTAKFEFLANGRLVVTGNNIKIVANKNQKDDIILLGNNCEIYTDDGDDIVRVAFVKDSQGYYSAGNSTNANGLIVGNEFGQTIYCNSTNNNRINTGSGNEYVVLNSDYSQVDGGDGKDKVLYLNNSTINNVEEKLEFFTSTISADGYEGWAMQGTVPDCRLLALINSICGNKNYCNLSDYVTITQSGTGYTVTFKNYPGTNKTASISRSEIASFDGVYGDLDTILIDMALEKLLSANHDRGKTSVSTAHYNTLANYLIGSEDMTFLSNIRQDGDTNEDAQQRKNYLRAKLPELWAKLQAGQIANLEIGIHTQNSKLGVVSGHAYSVKNLTNTYIELVNPWDDADVLKLDLEYFYSLDIEALVYGADVYNQNYLIPNGDGYITPLHGDASIGTIPVQPVFTGNETPIMEEIQGVQNNIEQIKALINSVKNKTIEELS